MSDRSSRPPARLARAAPDRQQLIRMQTHSRPGDSDAMAAIMMAAGAPLNLTDVKDRQAFITYMIAQSMLEPD